MGSINPRWFFGTAAGTLFGDGTAYGSITGSYTYSNGVWTITGAATVDLTSSAGVLMGRQLIVNSAGVLTVDTNAKCLLALMSESITVAAGGRIHIDKLGKAGNYGNLTPLDLIPVAWQGALSAAALEAYVVEGEGAAGGARKYNLGAGNSGSAAGAMQSGGGGGGASYSANSSWSGAGGKGGPCCGGAGSGAIGGNLPDTGTDDAGDYGGAGTNGLSNGQPSGGGAGDPVGTGTANGEGAGGGLLMLLAPAISIASTAIVSADGAKGGFTNNPGGSAGGGIVCIVTNSGGYTNSGTVRASGGAAQSSSSTSGAGGAGSVNILTAA